MKLREYLAEAMEAEIHCNPADCDTHTMNEIKGAAALARGAMALVDALDDRIEKLETALQRVQRDLCAEFGPASWQADLRDYVEGILNNK